MEKICLVEAGKFTLGIDAAVILSTRDAESFRDGELEEKFPLLHLGAFLGQQSLAVLKPEAVVLEVENCAGLSALLVDRVIGEIAAPDRFEPLPLLYPELTARCCPQLFIHQSQLVLQLDVQALRPIREKLQTTCGVVSLVDLSAQSNAGKKLLNP